MVGVGQSPNECRFRAITPSTMTELKEHADKQCEAIRAAGWSWTPVRVVTVQRERGEHPQIGKTVRL